jgi:DNA-directed RNA polymerase subunit RPC12/RpoP
MTIRYTCTECESVLKIKDEKAGTEGKCPRCKTKFLVPRPGAENDASELGDTDLSDNDIDMPLELTPDVEEMSEFDPMDVLDETPAMAPAPPTAAAPAENRPSVAELMRDFEATKKPREKKASHPTVQKAASMETIGTAADALSRAYQAKRDKASQPREPQKEVDPERELLYEFLRKAVVGVGGLLIVIMGIYWWMSRDVYEGPPLAETTGVVMQNGRPLVGVQVTFAPVSTPGEPGKPRSNAITDEEGRFTMQLTAVWSGAVIGDHEITIYDPNGLPLPLPDTLGRQTVTEDGPNEFRFDL